MILFDFIKISRTIFFEKFIQTDEKMIQNNGNIRLRFSLLFLFGKSSLF